MSVRSTRIALFTKTSCIIGCAFSFS